MIDVKNGQEYAEHCSLYFLSLNSEMPLLLAIGRLFFEIRWGDTGGLILEGEGKKERARGNRPEGTVVH